LTAILADAGGESLTDFVPAPPAADRFAWEGLPADLAARLVDEADIAKEQDWPLLTATLYGAFRARENRIDYETPYFTRRRMLNALVLGEAIENQGRFLDDLMDGIVLVCEESGWQLPAHNVDVRDGVCAPLPDPENPIVDLFAAETAAQLAVIGAILGETLGRVNPAVLRRMDCEIEQRVIHPYLSRNFWWQDDTQGPVNNWTAWCTQNVLVAAFARPFDQRRRSAVIAKAVRSLDLFLAAYDDDGACIEGALYYRRAALCLFGALTVMNQASGGAFNSVFAEKKIRNLAEFIVYAHIDGRYFVNFGDAPALSEWCDAREFLFGRAVQSTPLRALAAFHHQINLEEPTSPTEINLWYRLLNLFTTREMAAFAHTVPEHRDIFLASTGLFTVRDDHYVLAVQAGDNGDSHGHNDVGNVVVYKDGRPFLIDVGVETYSAKTFSSQRYDIWTMQSVFHNLPNFDGCQQTAGKDFAAGNIRTGIEDDVAFIALDLAGAYPAEAGVRHYHREARLIRGRGVEIRDRYQGSGKAVLSLMVAEPLKVEGNTITVGDLGIIDVGGAEPVEIEMIAVSDRQLRRCWPEQIFRLHLPLAGERLYLSIH
jgi:hypothetical protein